MRGSHCRCWTTRTSLARSAWMPALPALPAGPELMVRPPSRPPRPPRLPPRPPSLPPPLPARCVVGCSAGLSAYGWQGQHADGALSHHIAAWR